MFSFLYNYIFFFSVNNEDFSLKNQNPNSRTSKADSFEQKQIDNKINQILLKNPILTREIALKLEQLYYKKGDYELAYTMHNFTFEKQILNSRANNIYKKYIS